MKLGRQDGQAGYALATMLMVLVGLMPLGMFAAMQARLDLLIGHETRRALETFYTAEAGLEHALADLAEDPRFERLLAGPDFPFRHAPPEFFPRSPFRYRVIVEQHGAERVDVVSRGIGPLRASRTIAARVERSLLPALPGALFSAARGVRFLLGDDVSLVGARGTHREPETPALAMADAATAEAVSRQLERRRGRGLDPPGVRVRNFSGLEALARRAASSPNARTLDGDLGGALGSGVFVHHGALEIADAAGGGILVVNGPLRVRGSFQFSGLVLILGDVRSEPQSNVEIDGGLLQGPGATLLHLLGSGTIRSGLDGLAALDAASPGLWPRRFRITGWQERA
jgi:hypothetical protein